VPKGKVENIQRRLLKKCPNHREVLKVIFGKEAKWHDTQNVSNKGRLQNTLVGDEKCLLEIIMPADSRTARVKDDI